MKEIEEFKGMYWISCGGNIINQYGKQLATTIDKDGYPIIRFTINKKKVVRKIHRLVALAFIPNPLNKPQVNHIDGNKSNNFAWNLEWTTAKENVVHAFKNGLNEGVKGSKNTMAKLTEEQVQEIRRKYKTGLYYQYQLAEEYGVIQQAISMIVTGKRWKQLI